MTSFEAAFVIVICRRLVRLSVEEREEEEEVRRMT